MLRDSSLGTSGRSFRSRCEPFTRRGATCSAPNPANRRFACRASPPGSLGRGPPNPFGHLPAGRPCALGGADRGATHRPRGRLRWRRRRARDVAQPGHTRLAPNTWRGLARRSRRSALIARGLAGVVAGCVVGSVVVGRAGVGHGDFSLGLTAGVPAHPVRYPPRPGCATCLDYRTSTSRAGDRRGGRPTSVPARPVPARPRQPQRGADHERVEDGDHPQMPDRRTRRRRSTRCPASFRRGRLLGAKVSTIMCSNGPAVGTERIGPGQAANRRDERGRIEGEDQRVERHDLAEPVGGREGHLLAPAICRWSRRHPSRMSGLLGRSAAATAVSAVVTTGPAIDPA